MNILFAAQFAFPAAFFAFLPAALLTAVIYVCSNLWSERILFYFQTFSSFCDTLRDQLVTKIKIRRKASYLPQSASGTFFKVALVGFVVFACFRDANVFLFTFAIRIANNPLRKPTCRSASARRRVQRVFCKSIVRAMILRQFFKTNGMRQSG